MIRLSAQWEKAIRTEGEKAYPNECCGVLLGAIHDDDRRMVENIIPINNAREREEQYHRFKIEPEDVMRAEKEASARNLEVLGFYHSHPDHPARPSEYDRNNAFPFYSYIIVSVEKSTTPPQADGVCCSHTVFDSGSIPLVPPQGVGVWTLRNESKAAKLTSWRLSDDRKNFFEELVEEEK